MHKLIVGSRSKEMLIPLYLALVRLQLHSPVFVPPLQGTFRGSGASPEQGQQDDYMAYEERPRELGLLNLERRR